jgi:hypothetical protein
MDWMCRCGNSIAADDACLVESMGWVLVERGRIFCPACVQRIDRHPLVLIARVLRRQASELHRRAAEKLDPPRSSG